MGSPWAIDMGSDLRRFLRDIERAGLQVAQSRGTSHYVIKSATGQQVAVVSASASDWRSLRNCRAALRRQGFLKTGGKP